MKSKNKSKVSKDKPNKKEEKNTKTNDKNTKDTKSKDKSKSKIKENEEEENKEQIIPKENPQNIERFIYITKYSDFNSVKIINQLFQDINSKAFNLESKNDIISKELTEEEQNNNDIDYISGIQIMDNKLRLYIIEGITGKSILKVKNALPKTQMNDKNFMIFSDNSILFNKRLYSKFYLTLKFIKLRKNLREILTHFDIYTNANKYRNIYDTFMNLGAILRSETLRDINNSNNFPDPDKLLELERKYGDILNSVDLTGEKKIKKNDSFKKLLGIGDITVANKINKSYGALNQILSNKNKSIKSMKLMPIKKKVTFKFEDDKDKLKENNDEQFNNILNKINSPLNNKSLTIDVYKNCITDFNNKSSVNKSENNNYKSTEIKDINTLVDNSESANIYNTIETNLRYDNYEDNYNRNLNGHKVLLNKCPKIDARNNIFIKIMKERGKKKLNPIEIFNRNKEYLNKMPRKKSSGRFCRPFEGEYDKKKEILFNALKNNHYEEIVNEMRKKYIKDKKHYYTYSDDTLTLNFPMVENFRNEEYLNYLDNKSKWLVNKDFERYKQPEREKIYFPRINKEI